VRLLKSHGRHDELSSSAYTNELSSLTGTSKTESPTGGIKIELPTDLSDTEDGHKNKKKTHRGIRAGARVRKARFRQEADASSLTDD
jgi:hypothetical protein